MRTRLLLAVIGAMCISLLLAGCDSHSATMGSFPQQLGRAVSQLKVGGELRFSDLNVEPWEQLHIFAPYTPTSAIEAAINGKASSEIKAARLAERDDINLVVFLHGGKVQGAAAVPRDTVDFYVAEKGLALSREKAVFTRTAPDSVVLVPKEE